MANELKITITGDSASAEAAFKRSAEAVRQLASAEKELGAAAEAGNAQAKAIIDSYRQQAVAAEELVAVYKQTEIAATAQAAAQQTVGAAARHVVPQMQAASGALRELEGNFTHNIRAAERFLTTTLGLGPVLQAAFPVIGAAAFAGILVDIGDEAYKAYEKFVSLDAVSEKLFDDVKKLQAHDFINVQSIETATKRLDQASESASRLTTTAQGLHDVGMKDLFGQLAQGNLGGVGLDVGLIASAKNAAEEGAKKSLEALDLATRKVEMNHRLMEQAIETAHAGDGALQGEQRINAEYEKRIALAKETLHYTKERERAMGNPVAKDDGATEYNLAVLSAERDLQAQRSQIIRQAHAQVASEGIAAAREVATEDQRISTEVTENWLTAYKAQEEAAKKLQEAEHEATELWKRDHEEMLRMAALMAEEEDKAARKSQAAADRSAQFAERAGLESHSDATRDRLNASQASENQQVSALQAEQSNYDPNLGGQDAQKYQEIQNKITDIQRQGSAERIAIRQQETLQEILSFQQWATQVNQSLNTVMDKWLQGGEQMSRVWRDAADHMALDMLNALAKWGEKQLETELMVRVLHLGTAAQNNSVDAAAAAERKATEAAANVSSVMSYAAVAAAGAAAAVASIPFVGPAMAPAASAATFVDTAAYASLAAFDTGTDFVSKTGVAMIHEGERVLDRDQNRQITRALSKGGDDRGGGGGIHFHDHSNFSGIDGASVEGMFRQHGAAARREMMRQLRLSNRI